MFNFKHMTAILNITTQPEKKITTQQTNTEKQYLPTLKTFIQGLKGPTKFFPMKKFLKNPKGQEINPFTIKF